MTHYHYDEIDRPQKQVKVMLSCKHWSYAYPDETHKACPFKNFRHGRRLIVHWQDWVPSEKVERVRDKDLPDEPPF